MSALAELAPRLHRAHQAEAQRLYAACRERHCVRGALLSAERLVAHRELQLARAYSTRSPKYMAVREHKLADARRKLARLQARAERLGAVPSLPKAHRAQETSR